MFCVKRRSSGGNNWPDMLMSAGVDREAMDRPGPGQGKGGRREDERSRAGGP